MQSSGLDPIYNSNSNKCNGTAAGNRDISSFKGNGWSFNADHNPGGLGFHALDDPGSTSQQTYKLQVKCQSSNYAFNLMVAVIIDD